MSAVAATALIAFASCANTTTPPTQRARPEPRPPEYTTICPNEKDEPIGYGPQQWVDGSDPLQYTIRFENSPQASASVQYLKIVDTLEQEFDINSVKFGAIQIGHHNVDAGGASSYSGTIEVDEDLSIDIEAWTDTNTREVIWEAIAIDPFTGQPVTDPDIGFLPPNDPEAGDGEGLVALTTGINLGLSGTGTHARNTATIRFDLNQGLQTNTTSNTLDCNDPTSFVKPLSPFSAQLFTVSWQSSDGSGAGVDSHTIWVRDNAGPWSIWIAGTTNKSALFTGTSGHTYGFKSTAKDHVGRVEALASSADATTTVN